jgi:hypothetical protein
MTKLVSSLLRQQLLAPQSPSPQAHVKMPPSLPPSKCVVTEARRRRLPGRRSRTGARTRCRLARLPVACGPGWERGPASRHAPVLSAASSRSSEERKSMGRENKSKRKGGDGLLHSRLVCEDWHDRQAPPKQSSRSCTLVQTLHEATIPRGLKMQITHWE